MTHIDVLNASTGQARAETEMKFSSLHLLLIVSDTVRADRKSWDFGLDGEDAQCLQNEHEADDDGNRYYEFDDLHYQKYDQN